MPSRKRSAGPEFVRFFAPVQKALKDLGGSGRPAEVEAIVFADEGIPSEEQERVNKNGQPRLKNQVAWARYYLSQAGLIESSTRGVWSLTAKGAKAELSPDKALALFREVQKRFRQIKGGDPVEVELSLDLPPDKVQVVDTGNYREALLSLLRNLPPAGFERLCQRLLRESGFQQVEVTGRSGDGGIDGHGILQINPFVSFRVLFQCKRYAGSVPIKEVRDFRGTMVGRADKGIVLTTGSFTSDARKEAGRDGAPPIELVDGEKLISMIEDLELGLNPKKTYEIDEAFYDEFR